MLEVAVVVVWLSGANAPPRHQASDILLNISTCFRSIPFISFWVSSSNKCHTLNGLSQLFNSNCSQLLPTYSCFFCHTAVAPRSTPSPKQQKSWQSVSPASEFQWCQLQHWSHFFTWLHRHLCRLTELTELCVWVCLCVSLSLCASAANLRRPRDHTWRSCCWQSADYRECTLPTVTRRAAEASASTLRLNHSHYHLSWLPTLTLTALHQFRWATPILQHWLCGCFCGCCFCCCLLPVAGDDDGDGGGDPLCTTWDGETI